MKAILALMPATITLLLAGCCTPPQAQVPKWEYLVGPVPMSMLSTNENSEGYHAKQKAFLNDLGKDGWILVTMDEAGVFYLKRPLGATHTVHAGKWEYKVAGTPQSMSPGHDTMEEYHARQQAFLNDLGKDRWNLVTADIGQVFFLKRPVRSTETP